MSSAAAGMSRCVEIFTQCFPSHQADARLLSQVHTFLLRHVYASTMSTYHFSKFQAAFVTFFLSACVVSLSLASAQTVRLTSLNDRSTSSSWPS